MHYSDLIHPTVTIISDASCEYFIPLSLACNTAVSTILNGVTKKQLFSRVLIVICICLYDNIAYTMHLKMSEQKG